MYNNSWGSDLVCSDVLKDPNLFPARFRDEVDELGTGSTPESDCGRAESSKVPATSTKNCGDKNTKALATLKNHSEAEKRRRQRINLHLSTLRGLVPNSDKMDKAALLGEVVRHVKELKKKAREASRGLLIPEDGDEVRVEALGEDESGFMLRASVSCGYRPELLTDMKQILNTQEMKIVKAEVSTLEARVKTNLVLWCAKGKGYDGAETQQLAVAALHEAILKGVEREWTWDSEGSSPTSVAGTESQHSLPNPST